MEIANNNELDSLIQKVRLQVIEYMGHDPFENTDSRMFEYLLSRRVFIIVLNSLYNIVDNKKTQYVAKFINTDRSNLCIMIDNIKSGKNSSKLSTNISDKIINTLLLSQDDSVKSILYRHKNYLEEKLNKINGLINEL